MGSTAIQFWDALSHASDQKKGWFGENVLVSAMYWDGVVQTPVSRVELGNAGFRDLGFRIVDGGMSVDETLI